MAEACANTNSKEWKMLVAQTGEELAHLAFVANNYQIPEVKSISEIKKEIGFKPKVENFAGIASKLRKFNQRNGTSHYFTFKRAWGNTFELTLKYNYLPVNLEKQRQRQAAKGDPLYRVTDFDPVGFNQMYPASRTDEMLATATKTKTKSKVTVASTIFELEPGITEEKIQEIYDNYVNLMNTARAGKAMPFKSFRNLLKNYQVYKHKNTYIFGNYDANKGVFVTRVNSSPSSKELLAEAIPNLVEKGIDFISFVPIDYAGKLVRSGYTMSGASFEYNFKGEEMAKYALASNPRVFQKLFNKSSEEVTGKELEDYNESIDLRYTPVEINEDLIKQAGNQVDTILETYLNQFGITVKNIQEIQDKLNIDSLGFADILSKTAYIKNRADLPPVAGEFIAYMMQYNPLIKDIITELSNTKDYKNLNKEDYFKAIGQLIALDLENKLEGKYDKSLVDKIKDLIRQFFQLVGITPIDKINTNIGIISNNILQQNKRLITASLYKPGAFGKETQPVSMKMALDKDAFGKSIIYNLSNKGFILTGSTALSEQGLILRPDENPLHDIDWVSPFSRKETLDKFLSVYPEAMKVRDIMGDGYITDSYIIAPAGYSIRNYKSNNYNGKIIIDSYDVVDANGKVQGTYRLEKEIITDKNVEVVQGVEAKVIDFFSYDDYSKKNKAKPFTYITEDGQRIQLANWQDTFKAKLDFARYKDIWDYNRFIPNENLEFISSENRIDEMLSPEESVSELFESNPEIADKVYEALGFDNLIKSTDKIIWGHPAIGKSYAAKTVKMIDFDSYKLGINQKYNLYIAPNLSDSELRTDAATREARENWRYQSEENQELWNQFIREAWQQAKQDAKEQGAVLFASDLLVLREFGNEVDKALTMSDDLFFERSRQRNNYIEGPLGTEVWKGNLNTAVSNFQNKYGKKKVINTDKYLSDLFITPEQKQQAQQLYSQYLDTIFPDSKVKDIVYHGTDKTFDKFDINLAGAKTGQAKGLPGAYFFFDPDFASEYTVDKEQGSKLTQWRWAWAGMDTEEVEFLFPDVFAAYQDPNIRNSDTILQNLKDLIGYGDKSLAEFKEILKEEGEPDIESWGEVYLESFIKKGPIINALVNTKNPLKFSARGQRMSTVVDDIKKELPGHDAIQVNSVADLLNDDIGIAVDVFIALDSEQIHILGTKQDVEGFKKFAKQSSNRVDELIDSAEMQVADVEKQRRDKINTEILKERQLLKTVEDPEDYRQIISRIEKLKKAIDEAEGRVIRAKNIESFDEILDYADLQLKEIQALVANPAITADDVFYAQRILDLWIAAGDFSVEPHEHIILDEDEFNTDAIREAFSAVRMNAMDLQSRLTKIRKEHVTNFVRQYTDGKLSQEEIFKAIKDIHKLGTMTLNLSRHDDAMLQAIFAAVERANIEAQQEASEMWENLDELTKKFLKKSGGNYNILKQLTEDGKETGRAVSRFSSEFYETRNEMMKAAFWARDSKTGKLKKDKAKINAYFDWTNKNTISFDPRALFPDDNLPGGDIPAEFIYKRVTFSEKAKEEHIAELKNQLGEKGYEFYIKRVEQKIEKFKIRREAIYQSIQAEPGLSKGEKDALFETWQKEHSPYWGMDMATNPASRVKGKDSSGKETYFAPKGLREYVEQVPRRVIGGVETKWYDKNFARIEADEDLLAYHDYMMNLLNVLRYTLPQQKQALLGIGVLPTIEKSLMDIFQEKGMMMGIIPFWDKMKELQTTTDLATTVYSDINPLTGDIKKSIQVQFVEDTEAKVRDLVKQKTLKHQQDTGKPATNADRLRFRKEARDYLSKQKSWDVTKILKAYSLTVLAHKHKSIIEPQIRLAEQEFNRRKEIVTNKAGQPQTKNGKVVTEEGLDNLKSALEFFLDSTFYGVGGRKVEGISKTKLYTKQEEARKKELETLLENETDPAAKDWIQSQINGLGGYRTMSGVGDTVLKYMTLKGLGWNLFSAGSNIGFGAISNMIQASDGREYSMANFRNASILVMNSIGRNLSFNAWEGVNSNAVKIRTLMDKWDLLQTSNKEMFDMSQKSSMSKLKRFGPFSLQERSEYLNYAPVMVAIMMSDNFSATDPDGNKVTLWDAYDVKSGKLREGYTSDVDEVRLVQKIKRVIEMNHGDYNNALQVKATIAGRALTQFRTWMFEGFANRFEAEKVDYALSYGMDEPYIRKGRYRSYTKGQLLTTGAALGTAFLPGVGTALGAGIGYLGGKFFGMQTEENVLSDTLFTLKQLARKLMFQKTQFGDKFDAVDAANMRKNMTELYIMLTLMGVALLLKALAGDDDDEEQMVTNFLLNQTIRLRTDIGFYTNPLEFEKLTKTAVPMAQLVQDVSSLVADIGHLFDEDVKNDVFRSGAFKKQPKWLVHFGQIAPGPAQLIRLYKTGDKVME